MTQALRIAVADDEPLMRRWYESTLTNFGHEVVVSAADGVELIAGCREQKPDLVITDIEMPNADGITATKQLRDEAPLPVILVSAHYDQETVERAMQNHVLAYLVKPIKQPDLATAITLVMRRFQEFRALEQQADSLARALEDRKLIERAKGILMQRAGLDELEAFRRLQKLSQDKNQKLADVAKTIVTADEAFSSGEGTFRCGEMD